MNLKRAFDHEDYDFGKKGIVSLCVRYRTDCQWICGYGALCF
jgi:hypothetical protein